MMKIKTESKSRRFMGARVVEVRYNQEREHKQKREPALSGVEFL